MKIVGFQKLTLVDYPGHLAATIFLPGCDLRCGFCHNPDLVFNRGPESYTPKEIMDELISRRRFIDAVCITGGEPLLTLDIDFVRQLKKEGFKIKLDTNGFNSVKLKKLLDEKLIDYVAIDIKTIPTEYQRLTGCTSDVDELIESVRLATTAPAYEFRTTIVPGFHTPQIVRQMIDWLLFVTQKDKLQAFYLQQFIPRVGQMISADFDKIPMATLNLLQEACDLVKYDFDICEVRQYYASKEQTDIATTQQTTLKLSL